MVVEWLHGGIQLLKEEVRGDLSLLNALRSFKEPCKTSGAFGVANDGFDLCI